MSALSGTNLASFEHFRNQVKLHKDEVIQYIRSKTDNFSLPSYFTQCKEEDYEEGKKWDYRKLLEQTSPLNLQDLPRFRYGPEILIKVIPRATAHILLLVFINALFFTLSFVAFLKYDVR